MYVYVKTLLTYLYNVSCLLQGIDWLKYLNKVFENVSITMTEDDEVIVYAPEYMKLLADLIKKTPKR